MKRIIYIMIFLFFLCSCSKDEAKIEYETKSLEKYSEEYIKDSFNTDDDFKKYLEFNDEQYKKEIYASPGGIGNGEIDNEANIYDAINLLKPGYVLYLREGTYVLNEGISIDLSGSIDDFITIRNYPNEKVCLTSNNKNIKDYAIDGEYALMTIEDKAQYLIIEGIEFANIKAKNAMAIRMYGGRQNHIIIRDNIIHNINTSKEKDENYGANAILLIGEDSEYAINNIVIYNNKIYNNVLGYSESISIASNCYSIYVFNNILENNSNIGIDFSGNFGYCNDKEYDQPRKCIAAGNYVIGSKSKYDYCAGIYIDGAKDSLIDNNYISNSQYGIEVGSEEKVLGYYTYNNIVANNLIKNNLYCGIRVGGYDLNNSGIVKNTIIDNNELINNCSNKEAAEIIINMVDGLKIINNKITTNKYILDTEEFKESDIKNVVFYNNNYYSKENECIYYLNKDYTINEFIKEFLKNE